MSWSWTLYRYLGTQFLIGKTDEFRLQSIDGSDTGLKCLDPAVIGRAKNLTRNGAEHAGVLFSAASGKAVAIRQVMQHYLGG